MSHDDLLDDETLQPAAPSRQSSSPQGPRPLRLRVLSGPDRGRTLVLSGGEVVVGSGAGCELVLQDRAVSRRHLSLRPAPDGLHVSDLGSRNGTFHGGVRVEALVVSGPTRLRLGPETEVELAPEAPAGPLPAERFGTLVGRSAAMRQLFQRLQAAAASESSVLLLGETGTGKEALAAAIHGASRRHGGPFVVVDCGALPRDLAGSELFGHLRGSFTGATEHKRGLFEAAHRGTLFLDEIGELPLELQPQLLRVLENREIRPIGDTRSRPVDIRVVAATHRDLPQLIAEGRFRQDLYFRLAVVEAVVPPLRGRLDDVPLLVEHFLSSHGPAAFHVSDGLMARLMTYAWPGNVRELRNVVERCVSLQDQSEGLALPRSSGGAEEPRASPAEPADGREEDGAEGLGGAAVMGLPFKEAKAQLVAAFERDYLLQLLDRHGGNISRAAQEAGIDRNHIHRLVKRYRIPSRSQ